MAINNNVPAFPGTREWHGGYYGMSLRDWFAGQALAGMLAYRRDDDFGDFIRESHAAPAAYRYADAMLAAREQTPTRKE